MIPKKAVKIFLTRDRQDLSTWKEMPGSELLRKMRALPVRPPIWNKLKKHQRVCLLLGAFFKRFLFLADTGAGKTLISIALARYLRRAKVVHSVLVLVPRRVNKYAWLREIEKHSPNTKAIVLAGSSKHKWQLLDQDALLYIETYAGFVRMVTHKVTRRGRNRLAPDRKLVREASQRFQCLILDESTVAKTKARLPFRICRAISKNMPCVFGLTGTPFGRDPSDIWGQMFLIDKGHTLGETLGLFRAAFFTEKQNYWGGSDFTFNEKKSKQFHTFLQNRSIRYPADEADLPKANRMTNVVALESDANAYYQRAKGALIAAKGSFKETKNVFLRMRQISSGFVGYKDDETGAKAQYVFADNPKMEMLLSIVEDTDPAHKIVVFAEFIYSIDRIVSELKTIGVKATPVYGKTKDPEKALLDFDNDPDQRVIVLQNSMVMGLNLQIARYAIFYESPVSSIMRKQAERRVERQHSKFKSVFLIDLVCRGTMDQRILEFHKTGENLMRSLVEGRLT